MHELCILHVPIGFSTHFFRCSVLFSQQSLLVILLCHFQSFISFMVFVLIAIADAAKFCYDNIWFICQICLSFLVRMHLSAELHNKANSGMMLDI